MMHDRITVGRNNWVGFNDLNNLSAPFSTSNNSNNNNNNNQNIKSFASKNDTWMNEDADKVEILCRLHGNMTPNDIGIEIKNNTNKNNESMRRQRSNDIKVYRKNHTTSNNSNNAQNINNHNNTGGVLHHLRDNFDKTFALPHDANVDDMRTSLSDDGHLFIITIPKFNTSSA